MLKKTLVIGASGYIGGKLFDQYRQRFSDCIGTSFSNVDSKFTYFSLEKSKFSDLAINKDEYQTVIICAAITDIALVNDEPAHCYQMNVKNTLSLIHDINALGLNIIYLSSDNVFSGDKGKYLDSSDTMPISEYGKQKLAVEKGIQKLSGHHTIVRLSKIVGVERGDNTIIDDIYHQLKSHQEIKAAEDLVFNPTYIGDVLRAIDIIQEEKIFGVLHFCNIESWNRHQLTEKIAEKLRLPNDKIRKVKFANFDSIRPRPLNTTMINSFFFNNFIFTTLDECISIFSSSTNTFKANL
jgi:dTDP-4-dehydrorhamnose reductase